MASKAAVVEFVDPLKRQLKCLKQLLESFVRPRNFWAHPKNEMPEKIYVRGILQKEKMKYKIKEEQVHLWRKTGQRLKQNLKISLSFE